MATVGPIVQAAVELSRVTKIYRGGSQVAALRDVSLTIAPAALVAVMGPSGSGKSTLLNLIGGLDVPTSGRVVVGGEDVGAMSEAGRSLWRRREVGFVFQAYHLLPTLSAAENVALPLHVNRLPAAEIPDRVARALDEVGLADRAAHLPDELSGGERQRVAIARALAVGPRLLLADEPTGNLDSVSGQQVLELLLGRTRTRGATLVMVTHNEQAAARCDRIVRLRDGQVDDEAPR
jgi:putative ABC transport system ATP-binding protein